jgi:putative FmdB family regulatory protein
VPTYQYACTECGDRSEVVQRFSDDPLTVCSACGGRLRKVFSPVGIVFKGSGFYRTDSRNGASTVAAGKDGAPSKDGAGSKDGAASSSGGSESGSNGSSSSSGSSSDSGSSSTSSSSSSGSSSGDKKSSSSSSVSAAAS